MLEGRVGDGGREEEEPLDEKDVRNDSIISGNDEDKADGLLGFHVEGNDSSETLDNDEGDKDYEC